MNTKDTSGSWTFELEHFKGGEAKQQLLDFLFLEIKRPPLELQKSEKKTNNKKLVNWKTTADVTLERRQSGIDYDIVSVSLFRWRLWTVELITNRVRAAAQIEERSYSQYERRRHRGATIF